MPERKRDGLNLLRAGSLPQNIDAGWAQDDGRQTSFFCTTRVALSDSLPTLYVVHGRAKPVLCGPNSTEPNPFYHGETTYSIWLKGED